MLWVLIDVLVGVVAVVLLLLVAFLLYKRVRGLLRSVGKASDLVGDLTAELNTIQKPSVRG